MEQPSDSLPDDFEGRPLRTVGTADVELPSDSLPDDFDGRPLRMVGLADFEQPSDSLPDDFDGQVIFFHRHLVVFCAIFVYIGSADHTYQLEC